MNITVTELEGKFAFLLLKKVIKEKDSLRKHKPNEIKREVVKVAEELGVKPEDLYSLYRRIVNELVEEARLPEKMDFTKQG